MSPVRRVRRVIRKIDPWTVLKVSLILNAIVALAVVLGSIVFWSVFVNAGIPDKISEFAEKLTLSFEADGPTYFRVVLLLCIIWTVGSTGLLTVSALLYNLISDVVGGIEVVVLEETLVVPAQALQQQAPEARARPVRKARFGRKAEEVPPEAGPPAVEPAPQAEPPPALKPVPAPEPDGEPVAVPAAVADLPPENAPDPDPAPAVSEPASEPAVAREASR